MRASGQGSLMLEGLNDVLDRIQIQSPENDMTVENQIPVALAQVEEEVKFEISVDPEVTSSHPQED